VAFIMSMGWNQAEMPDHVGDGLGVDD